MTAASPIFTLDIYLDKRYNERNDIVFTTVDKKHETNSSRFTRIPVIIIVYLLGMKLSKLISWIK